MILLILLTSYVFFCVYLAIKRILTILEEIKQQNCLILDNQLSQMQRADTIEVPAELPAGINLPIASLEELLRLDEICLDADIHGNLVLDIFWF